MALTQYNDWEPVRDGIVGNMQAQPRVFAHDAKLVVPGAVNYSHSNFGLEIVSGGSGYAPNVAFKSAPTSGGSGTGLSIDATADANGVVTSISLYPDELSPNYNPQNNAGQGYAVGDVLTMGGVGTGFQLRVVNINIPNTQKRGCCLYVGSSGSCEVEMESGHIATFAAINAGSFLPILVVRVIPGSNTDVTNVLAIY